MLGVLMNLVTTLGYWLLVHHATINDFSGYALVHMYTAHTLPQVSFALNWYCTDVVLVASHKRIVLGVAYQGRKCGLCVDLLKPSCRVLMPSQTPC